MGAHSNFSGPGEVRLRSCRVALAEATGLGSEAVTANSWSPRCFPIAEVAVQPIHNKELRVTSLGLVG